MNTGNPVKPGMLLVSEPYSYDPFFRRSVVLVTEHNADGSVGFILNKGLNYRLKDLVESIKGADFRISLGGPVGHTTLNFIHTLGNITIPNAHHVGGGLYWGGNFEILTGMINFDVISRDEVLFFLGYSGWSQGQLEDEVARGDWAVIPAAGYDLMHAADTLWYDIVHEEPLLIPWRYIPENPSDN